MGRPETGPGEEWLWGMMLTLRVVWDRADPGAGHQEGSGPKTAREATNAKKGTKAGKVGEMAPEGAKGEMWEVPGTPPREDRL